MVMRAIGSIPMKRKSFLDQLKGEYNLRLEKGSSEKSCLCSLLQSSTKEI